MTPESVASWSVPAISSIQRTNVVLVAVAAAILALFASPASAIGCLLGGAVVIADLWILAAIGRVLRDGAPQGTAARRETRHL